MNIFLKLKHWQLFVLLMGIPFFQIIVEPENQTIVQLLAALFLCVYFGWLYSLGVNLHKKLPSSVKMNLKKFKWRFFVSIAVMLLTGVLAGTDNEIAFVVMLIPSLVLAYCIFYCYYFIAKALKAVESQEPNEDFLGEFFYLWFFPIGVWLIQPRVNKIFDENLQNKITA